MFALHLGNRGIQDATQSSRLDRFVEHEVGSQIESFFSARQTVHNHQNKGLLVRGGAPQFGERVCASGHIVTIDHNPIQMPAGGKLDRTRRILAEMKRGSARTQTCLDLTEQSGIASHDQAL